MRILTLILLFISLNIQATTYYLDPAGVNDAGRDGSIGQPWLTLAYAVTRVAADAGHVIHFNAGTYSLSSRVTLPTGISLEGVGVASVILVPYRGDGTQHDGAINVETLVEGTNGNQSIHDLKFDGQYYGTSDAIIPPAIPATIGGKTAITVHCRSNVEIYNCTFQNFWHSAAVFYGGESSWASDVGHIYAEGNSYHHNISTNCSNANPPPFTWENTGHVYIQGQKDMLIYNNTMTQGQRTAGYNGMCIDAVEGFFKALKIYNNIMTQTPASNEVGFTIELWYPRGGLEIYNNTISLCVDLARGVIKGDYTFAAKVYDNTIGHASQAISSSPYGVMLEWDNDEVYIYNNWIKNVRVAINISSEAVHTLQNIYIYYNIFQDCFYPGDGAVFFYTVSGAVCTFTNIHIYNNVMYNKTGVNAGARSGVGLPQYGTCSNFYIKNNIIVNSSMGCVWGRDAYATMNNLVITNNILYNNANANMPLYERNYFSKVTNYTGPPSGSNKLGENPLFISATNFHLQNGSPAIDAGVILPFSFITMDYDSVLLSGIRESGAYEKDGIPPLPDSLATVLTNEITDIGLTTATGGGNVTDDGGDAVTARGVCWDTSTEPTIADSFTTNGTGLGTFTSSLTGLINGTSYFVRAYATNGVGTAYGNEVTFETGPPSEPIVGTAAAIRTSDTTATGHGNVVSAGGGTVTSRGVCWSISPDPTKADSFATAAAGGLGEFTALMTGLMPTIYYVRAWATNETTTSYGNAVTINMTKGQLRRISAGLKIVRIGTNAIRVE